MRLYSRFFENVYEDSNMPSMSAAMPVMSHVTVSVAPTVCLLSYPSSLVTPQMIKAPPATEHAVSVWRYGLPPVIVDMAA